ncbi:MULTISPECIES: hypothetical protein [Klebsiella]|uniref:Uncharacterized protein n=1 Tax=Klebsiella michiganensis TaxID=1134687 RepID=A0AB35Q280_9ENTR|nr:MULTISPECIES: hypothetical protein [Klebsiella]AID89325.1 hypothetical protein KONIH1_09720 [Klebsiella oxytoca KONIH1]APM34008.1 hypothetical protein AGH21_26900 [Klebsiella oxytoca]MDU1358829.1 hypothetical protein [Citrobacter freundii]DAP61182.1 MAG TPA: hypothetical protein [Caudoviricetes sp.]AIE69548.1 hypothetical protein HR38_14170 [Klebsiella michiganensis]
MSKAKILTVLFRELQDAVLELNEGELEKIISGEYQFVLKVVKKRIGTSAKISPVDDFSYSELLNLLNQCESREQGNELLSRELKTKSEFEKFARHVEVAVMKSDKLEKIRDNIIESTVGAKLRSDAIQNKN